MQGKLCGLGVQGNTLTLPPGAPTSQGGPGRLFSGSFISWALQADIPLDIRALALWLRR